MIKKNIIALILCFTALFAWTQETASIPRKMAVFVVNKNLNQKDLVLYSNSFVIQLEEDPDIVVMEPLVYQNLDETGKADRTKELGGDSYVEIQLESSGSSIIISYMSYDLYNDRLAIPDATLQEDSSFSNLKQNLFYNVISEIGNKYESITGELTIKEIKKFTFDESANVMKQGIKIVIYGLPGTRITGLEKEHIISENGTAIAYVPRFTTQKIQGHHYDYYPAIESFYIEDQPEEIILEQKPATRIAFDVFLYQLDYIGANFAFYFYPNFIFAQTGVTYLGKKLIFPVEDSQLSHLEAPILNISLAGGYYFNSEDQLLRFSLKHGAFLSLLISEELGVQPNPLAGFAINVVSANMEISPYPKLRAFLEYSLVAYLTNDANQVKQAMYSEDNSDSNVIGYIFMTPFIFDLLDIKIGVRFQI
ncbi:MAG: hypothetical protein JXR70_06450 [Spirochaetales bacterium]|nr:hypothetical protein [Spirochaetales bacterium]